MPLGVGGGGLGGVGGGHLVGAFAVQFLLVFVPLHEVLHEAERHFAPLQFGATVFVFDG